jgi:hypothetical protein
MARGMLQTLESHAASNLHHLWTGDEWRMVYEYQHGTIWAAEEQEFSLSLSELMSKSLSDMILWIFADWGWPSRRCFLMKVEYVE